MKKLFATLLMVVASVSQAEILAVYEESPNGLVRVDQQNEIPPQYIKQQQTAEYNPQADPNFVPGRVYPDYIYRPMYKLVSVYVPECKCSRNLKVRIN